MKTRNWRMCLVKQVPEQSSSCWMLFGRKTVKDKTKTMFQMEFKPHQETTLINHLANLAHVDEETWAEIRLMLIRESPTISCIESLWALKGVEMYRKQFETSCGLMNSLHQDVHMLIFSPQIEDSSQIEDSRNSHHSMQTRSKAKH